MRWEAGEAGAVQCGVGKRLLLLCETLTPVVLLLLVIIAQLPLSLRCHPSLGLHHLLCLIGARRLLSCLLRRLLRCLARLESLVGVIALKPGSRAGAHAVVLANRVVSGGALVAVVCNNKIMHENDALSSFFHISRTTKTITISSSLSSIPLTIFISRTPHHGRHRFPTAWACWHPSHPFPALYEIVGRTVNLCVDHVSLPFPGRVCLWAGQEH